MTFAEFKKMWLGRRVDTDNYPANAKYQCVDLVKRGLRDIHGVPFGAYGNAVAYWYRTAAPILKKFDQINSSAAKEGDIVVLKGVNGNAAGHIGWGMGKNYLLGFTQILEQNGSTGNGQGTGNDAVRVRWIPRTRVLGLLRRKKASQVLYHKVVLGNTLGYLAGKYGTTVKNIQSWNAKAYPSLVKNPNYIKVGWKLRVR